VLDYVLAYLIAEVTARGTDYIQVEAVNGQIESPKQWALLEIQRTILQSDIFNERALYEAMYRAGFTGFPIPALRVEAGHILRSFYEALPDPTV
jgi:hypothetical protein